jgi:hypothetical protein
MESNTEPVQKPAVGRNATTGGPAAANALCSGKGGWQSPSGVGDE